MDELFEFIKARIKDKVPEFKTVDMFNDQLDKGNVERTEKAFAYPAVFVQFVTSEVRNRAQGIQDLVLQVIFHFGLEGYKFSSERQLKDMQLTAKFDHWIHRLRGSEDDPVQFTTFNRIILNESENFDNVNKPILTYSTMWRNSGSYMTPEELDVWTYEINGEITATD